MRRRAREINVETTISADESRALGEQLGHYSLEQMRRMERSRPSFFQPFGRDAVPTRKTAVKVENGSSLAELPTRKIVRVPLPAWKGGR